MRTPWWNQENPAGPPPFYTRLASPIVVRALCSLVVTLARRTGRMPLYEFACSVCDRTFEHRMSHEQMSTNIEPCPVTGCWGVLERRWSAPRIAAIKGISNPVGRELEDRNAQAEAVWGKNRHQRSLPTGPTREE